MKSKIGFVGGLLAVFAILQGVVFAAGTYNMGTVSVPTVGPLVATTSKATTTIIAATTTASTTCVNFLATFHKVGDTGEDVVKLQKFLNKYNNAKLNEKGYFGSVTMQEVKNFQYTYGIKTTGAQYQLTTEVINKIVCGKLAIKERKVCEALKIGIIK